MKLATSAPQKSSLFLNNSKLNIVFDQRSHTLNPSSDAVYAIQIVKTANAHILQQMAMQISKNIYNKWFH